MSIDSEVTLLDLWMKSLLRLLMVGFGTTAVKRLNRYFCFLLLGLHLPVREKWAKMYKSVSQHNYLSIFLKRIMFENGADNNVSIGFQSLRTFLVNF